MTRGLTVLDFKAYYKTTVMNAERYWQQDIKIEHLNNIQSPEIDAHIYKFWS